MLQGETYLATIFKNGNGTKAMLHQQNINKRYFYLQFFRTAPGHGTGGSRFYQMAFKDKQAIVTPLNKDHCATIVTGVNNLRHRISH